MKDIHIPHFVEYEIHFIFTPKMLLPNALATPPNHRTVGDNVSLKVCQHVSWD